jgi:glycogen(starch) synthase
MIRPRPENPNRPGRIFHAAGPGDAVRAHYHWKRGEQDPNEVSITFTSQIEQYCIETGASLYLVCYHPRRDFLRDGPISIEHLPKPMSGARGAFYHLREVLYGFMLLVRALRFNADVAILDSGCTHFVVQTLFATAGIRVVPVLHNSLWPRGYPPGKPVARLIQKLDRFFWRHVPLATLCVSPECARQVEQLATLVHGPLEQIRAQFLPEFFGRIPPAPPHSRRPFRILFIGRVIEDKGVFDLLEMAARIEGRAPGRVRWELCGTGNALEELRRRRAAMGMEEVVNIRGWTSQEDLVGIYARSHAAIVPTRSSFLEGLAMTAAEAILAGRPVITSPVVPALEVLRPSAVAARTNDIDSYVEQILKLIDDPSWYESMVRACPEVARPFTDREQGLTAALQRVLGGPATQRLE